MLIDKWVNSILAGCGKESEKLELQSILYQIAEEYHAGKITEDELNQLAIKLCDSVVALAHSCGKSLTHDKCVDDMVKNIKVSLPRGVLRSLLAGRRRTRAAGATSGETGILG